MPLIQKSDFPAYVPLTINIKDEEFNPHLRLTIDLDLKHVLSKELFVQVRQLPVIELAEYVDAGNVGKYYIYDDKVFKVLIESVNTVPVAGVDWGYEQIQTLFHVYVKPYVVFQTMYRFTLHIGRKFTQFGLSEPIERSESQPISDKGRSELMAGYRDVAEQYKSRLQSFLRTEGLIEHNRCSDGWHRDGCECNRSDYDYGFDVGIVAI